MTTRHRCQARNHWVTGNRPLCAVTWTRDICSTHRCAVQNRPSNSRVWRSTGWHRVCCSARKTSIGPVTRPRAQDTWEWWVWGRLWLLGARSDIRRRWTGTPNKVADTRPWRICWRVPTARRRWRKCLTSRWTAHRCRLRDCNTPLCRAVWRVCLCCCSCLAVIDQSHRS